MRRASGWQVPQRVFILLMRASATGAPTRGSHLASSAGNLSRSCRRVPALQHGVPRIPVGTGTNGQLHGRVIQQPNRLRASALYESQPVTPTLVIMTLAAYHLPLGLANLLLEFGLPPPNPAQACSNGQPHGVVVQVQRCGHTHPAARRVDAQMEVLDVLADDLHRYAAHVDAAAVDVSSHAGPSRSRRSYLRGSRCRRAPT